MANREKGEATLTVGSGDRERTYRLVLNFHAWALAQDAVSRKGYVPTIEQISDRIGRGSILYTLALFWAVLQKHHPEIDSMDKAADLMEKAGAEASLALLDAMGIARPDPKDIAELALQANPQTAQGKRTKKGGTGVNSSSPVVASA